LISLVNFHEMALQSIWWRDISKDPLFELLQVKFQPERTRSSRLIVIWSEIGAQKSALLSRLAIPQIDRCNDKIIGLWIDSSSTLFSGFGPEWLLSVFKLKNLARWEEILVKWGSHCRRQWVLLQTLSSLLRMTTKRELCVLSEIWPEGVRRWIFRDVASSNGL